MLRVLVVTLSGLALYAAAVAGYSTYTALTEGGAFSPASTALMAFTYTLLAGALPALLVGAPLFALLHRRGQARWHWVLLLGAMPSVAFAFVGAFFFWLALAGGLFVASFVRVVLGKAPTSP